jgi:hypothetical protein
LTKLSSDAGNRSTRLTHANVMATVAVFLALGGGAYALTGIPDRAGIYHGCADAKSGALRVVVNASSCRRSKTITRGKRHLRVRGEFAIAWNQQGRQGQQGLQGIQGPPGKDGTQGPAGSFADVLPSGNTIRGAFYFKTTISSYSFAFSLPSVPIVNIRPFGAAASAECPGSAQDPQAAPGHLCLYQSNNSVVSACVFATDDPMSSCTSATKFGFGASATGDMSGQWAVTAL